VATEVDLYPPAKRLLDRSVAVALAVLLSPLFALALAAMAWGSLRHPRDRGPFLYRERRVSQGREFDLLKFRTLRHDVLRAHVGKEGHARLLEADPGNLTWAGQRVLKPWYLDELPQLLNVLRGEMSLVGPRPWPPSMVARQVESGLDYRLHVPAGWTGPAQVQKGITEPAGYAGLDLDYVESMGRSSGSGVVARDLRILWGTVKVLARGEGLRY
jgi:lipopolysaccharide/colanic/teichoic acid biosynthesis glycosyltransferase